MADRKRLISALRDFERGLKISHLSPQESEQLIATIKQRIANIDAELEDMLGRD